MAKTSQPAKHTQSLRQRHKDQTRGLILQALAEIVAARGVHNFSVQEVADQAGVAHRTVYHHFPTREALLEALAEWLDAKLRSEGAPSVPTVAEDVPENVERIFSLFDEHAPLVKALAITYTTTGLRPSVREERTQVFRQVLRDAAPEATDEEIQQAWIVVRGLASSQTWLLFRDQLGISGREAGKAVSWAIRLILEDLRSKRRRGQEPLHGENQVESQKEVRHGAGPQSR